ncbi:CDK2-associated protein 2 [Intoshia linei]|uniref:CDK2-associated protein 2 n=1 Tax=Intoshia linei TaxID=1819745 RepID=A0A177ASM3_9BILA|nr:CDK2-associated protein 2 [Intoshia linei]
MANDTNDVLYNCYDRQLSTRDIIEITGLCKSTINRKRREYENDMNNRKNLNDDQLTDINSLMNINGPDMVNQMYRTMKQSTHSNIPDNINSRSSMVGQIKPLKFIASDTYDLAENLKDRDDDSTDRYNSLVNCIHDMCKDIHPSYTNNRTCSERLKRNIIQARLLVRECLMECEKLARS